MTALHAIPDTSRTIAEWRRVLRQDGRVVTATFVQVGHEHPGGHHGSYPANHEPFHSADALARTTAAHGFNVVRTTEWSDGNDVLLIGELAVAV